MMQPLSYEILYQIDPKNINLDNYSDDSSIGPLVEVDVDHPDEMHDLHNHCTLAAEKIKVAT